MTKRKVDCPQAEADLAPEVRERIEGSTHEEGETGAAAGGSTPAEPGSEGMEPDLFEDLLASVREAGAILRGERQAGRRTCFAGADEEVHEGPGAGDLDAREAGR